MDPSARNLSSSTRAFPIRFLSTPGAPANELLRTATLRLAVRWVDDAQIAAMFDQLQSVSPGICLRLL